MPFRVHAALALVAGLALTAGAGAADPFTQVCEDANQRLVKIFGAGGFRGITNYGSGVLVSADGHILTIASQTLDTAELVVHLADGRRLKAAVVATEPELDVALLKIRPEGKKPEEPTGLNLPFYDVPELAKRPAAKPGEWVLAFTNAFEIAMRDEPVTVQRGVVAAVSKLSGRRGIFDFPFTGEVYVIDAITNNPGAGGGALTDRKGNLLGLVGRDLKNALTETWINYAIPLTAKAELRDGDKVTTVTVPQFVTQGVAGTYKVTRRLPQPAGVAAYHGIVFVPNVLERTPPYVDEVEPNSPAAAAGLKPNDLVSFLDGEPVTSVKAFQDAMARIRPGTAVRLEVRRGDSLQSLELKLAEPKKSK